jgi:Acetyltransferase (GNAT) domain
VRIELKPVAALGDGERAALRALTTAVYPPGSGAASPGRHLQWAPPEYSVLIWSSDGALVSHVGIVVRAGTLDGAPVTIGGVGSVKTHPAAERHGYASAGLRRAQAALVEEHRVEFSLLVCQEHLLPFYGRLGWLAFGGRLLVQQPAGRILFTVNRPMVQAARAAAPRAGTIDLEGLPW